MIPENKRKLSIKDPKLFTEYFPIEQRETIRTHLKPWVETYLQISEVPDQVAGVLKSLDECNIHLDLNLNLSLTQEVKLVLYFSFNKVKSDYMDDGQTNMQMQTYLLMRK